MRAVDLLTTQATVVHGILHDFAGDLTPTETTTRALPNTNLLAFDLWHIIRARDWALQTMIRGVPELIEDPRWRSAGRLATHGIGVGYTADQADDLARAVALPDLLAYADATQQAMLDWLATQTDDTLDDHPDVPGHLARYPVYLETAMRDEVPWMFQQPPVWRCFSPAVNHARDHLNEMLLIKAQLRLRA
jgi:hypothetical protein